MIQGDAVDGDDGTHELDVVGADDEDAVDDKDDADDEDAVDDKYDADGVVTADDDDSEILKLQKDFWEHMGEMFGYDIIGSKTHPLKNAFALYCEMKKEQKSEEDKK